MTKRVEIILGVVFLIVGMLSTANTIRLNSYIHETLPRDTAQEACQLATLQSLRVWAVGRGQIEDAKKERDAALFPLFHALERSERPSPDVASTAEQELQNVDVVRENVESMLAATPIPDCKLTLNR
jgi:hypothetical protein